LVRQVSVPHKARNACRYGRLDFGCRRGARRRLGGTEVVWKDIFAKDGRAYKPPRLVIYSGSTDARCGTAQSAMGPFYCPLDETVYLDTSFFREIQSRFRGCEVGSKSCEFAQAYVIAHEVAHYVQTLLGTLPRVQQQQQASQGKSAANHLQVEVELQADCFAGVWANRSDQQWNLLQSGDVDAALRTAAAIGDDTLQASAGSRRSRLIHAWHLRTASALVELRSQRRNYCKL
jgi:predicted metalloprotease